MYNVENFKYLENTLSSNNNVRKQSETYLLNAGPEIVPQLLSPLVDANLTANSEIPYQLEIAALTLIKNRIFRDWNKNIDNDYSSTVKSLLKDYLLKFNNPFNQSNHLLINMTLAIIQYILAVDNSGFQNDLLQWAHDRIVNGGENNFYIGTLVIQIIAKRSRNLENGPTNDIVNIVTPHFANYLKSYYIILTSGQFSNSDSQITYQIIKTINYLTISKNHGFQSYEKLHETCQLIAHILLLEFTHFKHYKISKWIFRLFIKLHIANANIDALLLITDSNDSIFSNILANINNVFGGTDDENENDNDDDDYTKHVKSRCIYFFINFLTRLISKDETYQYIEPNLNIIISQIIMKLLSFNQSQILSFDEDPEEFINTNISSPSIASSPQFNRFESPSISFLNKLIKKRQNTVPPLISLAKDIISSNSYNSLPCALTILTLIQKYLDPSEFMSYISKINQINASLTESQLWLRSLIYEFISNVSIPIDLPQFNLPISLDFNQPLPLLLASIKLVITKTPSVSTDAVRLIQILLTISDKENLEIVPDLIHQLATRCGDQLVPYSVELIENLASSFVSLFDGVDGSANNISTDSDDSRDDKLQGILNNILTIIIPCDSDKNVIHKINEKLTPVISIVLENGLLDFLESTLELLVQINYSAESILNLEITIDSFKNYGFNYFEYYESYFLLAYSFSNANQRAELNSLLNWILEENPAGLDNDDSEFIAFFTLLVSEMTIASREDRNDSGLSDSLYSKTFQMLYDMYDDKDEFWDEKDNYRFILAGLYNKTSVVISIFGDENIHEFLVRFDNLFKSGRWVTVNQTKLSLLALMEVVSTYEDTNMEIKQLALTILSNLCDNLKVAFERREELIKISSNDLNTDDVEINYEDDEYDEIINDKTRLERIDVFGQLEAFSSKYNN